MSDLANAFSRPSTSVTLHTMRKTPSREDNSSRTRACNSVKSSSAASQFSLPVGVVRGLKEDVREVERRERGGERRESVYCPNSSLPTDVILSSRAPARLLSDALMQ